jgi:MoaA/NifB/PqqE/SkfB family radical SAM enzyme
MADDMIETIATELDEMDYAGCVSLVGVNEPTLDPRLLDVASRLRGPGRSILVSTNGDVWRRDPAGNVLRAFERGVNTVLVDAYDDRTWDAWSPAMEELFVAGLAERSCNPYVRRRGRAVVMRDNREFLATTIAKSGERNLHDWQDPRIAAFIGRERAPTRGMCARPFRQLAVRHDGRVRLCCVINPSNDGSLVGGLVAGDTTGMRRAWNGAEFNRYRAALQDGRRIGACDGCMARSAFPGIVRRVASGDPAPSRGRGGSLVGDLACAC